MVVVVVERLSERSSKTSTTTTVRAEFARLVDPLEKQVGRRLGNPQRQHCVEAFAKFPEGVRQVVEDVLRDATRNPLGLLVWRIKNGWHELEPLPAPKGNAFEPREGESAEEFAERLIAEMRPSDAAA